MTHHRQPAPQNPMARPSPCITICAHCAAEHNAADWQLPRGWAAIPGGAVCPDCVAHYRRGRTHG